ncbi:hypothetical protein ACIGEO_02980 [Stenotrophomonas bentonitica]|uniref:hypothetical protein n=1 Tax=Stenotrophomonas bentonitica TaxID=1450134 RepID=UPI0037CD09B4
MQNYSWLIDISDAAWSDCPIGMQLGVNGAKAFSIGDFCRRSGLNPESNWRAVFDQWGLENGYIGFSPRKGSGLEHSFVVRRGSLANDVSSGDT